MRLSFAEKWMELVIILSKISQVQKDKDVFSHMQNLEVKYMYAYIHVYI
jgi:hypothetical protein